MEKTPEKSLREYDEEYLDSLKDQVEWLEEQKVIAEQALQNAETAEDKQKYQETIEKVGRYLAQNHEWMARIQTKLEGGEESDDDADTETDDLPTAAEATPDSRDIQADDVDSAEEQKKSVTVTTTNPYTGQHIVGQGATEEEAIADANQQINDYREGMK